MYDLGLTASRHCFVDALVSLLRECERMLEIISLIRMAKELAASVLPFLSKVRRCFKRALTSGVTKEGSLGPRVTIF